MPKVSTLRCNSSPRVALTLLDPQTEATLQDVFLTCGVEPVVITADGISGEARDRVIREKFEGCAVALDENAAQVIEAIRDSPLNKRIIVYGVSPDERPPTSLLRLGINVVFRHPVNKREAASRVRSTRALLIHELRRYLRVPLAVRVTVKDGGKTTTLMSREISGGGMSVEADGCALPKHPVRLLFPLPKSGDISIMASLCWQAEGSAGLQFQKDAPAAMVVKGWIEAWLGIG